MGGYTDVIAYAIVLSIGLFIIIHAFIKSITGKKEGQNVDGLTEYEEDEGDKNGLKRAITRLLDQTFKEVYKMPISSFGEDAVLTGYFIERFNYRFEQTCGRRVDVGERCIEMKELIEKALTQSFKVSKDDSEKNKTA